MCCAVEHSCCGEERCKHKLGFQSWGLIHDTLVSWLVRCHPLTLVHASALLNSYHLEKSLLFGAPLTLSAPPLHHVLLYKYDCVQTVYDAMLTVIVTSSWSPDANHPFFPPPLSLLCWTPSCWTPWDQQFINNQLCAGTSLCVNPAFCAAPLETAIYRRHEGVLICGAVEVMQINEGLIVVRETHWKHFGINTDCKEGNSWAWLLFKIIHLKFGCHFTNIPQFHPSVSPIYHILNVEMKIYAYAAYWINRCLRSFLNK